jgi:hypothetical protein
VRKENRRRCFIYDALKGGIVDRSRRGSTTATRRPTRRTAPRSPSREQGRDRGHLRARPRHEAGRNATDDPYFDTNPSWSSDGKQILYNRRVGGLREDLPRRRRRSRRRSASSPFGTANDIMPQFAHDENTILFSSDRWEGIYDICKLDLKSGEVGKLTDLVGGGFSPVQLNDLENKPQAAYVAIHRGPSASTG